MVRSVTCVDCGSVYRRTSERGSPRDRDSFDCQVCDIDLDSWVGERNVRFDLISKGRAHLRSDDAQGVAE